MRAIHPNEKPICGVLGISGEAFNPRLWSDRIIVENFFGRSASLCSLFASKCRWSEKIYNDFMRMDTGIIDWHRSHRTKISEGLSSSRKQWNI